MPADRTPSRDPSRRQFLKATAATAAAVGGLSLARSAHAEGKEEITVGMIGCGGRCSGAAREAMDVGPYVKLVAMCDVFPDRVERRKNDFRRQRPQQMIARDEDCLAGFEAYKRVIERADVVLIACASKFHPMYAEAAVRAGKHVFVEKPHGIDPVGVRRMQAACDLAKQKNLSLLSGMQSRFHDGYREAIQRVQDGQIGEVVAIQSMFLRGPYVIVPRDPKLSECQYQFSNWYHFRWLSGDDVTQSLVHNLDRVSWLLKEEMPLTAFGLGGRSSSFGEIYGDMFDHHTVVYEYASGVRVYALCRTQHGCYDNANDVILGSQGRCVIGGAPYIEGKKPWRSSRRSSPYFAEQKALIESVRNGKPINSGYHMANSTLVAVMGQISCYTGKQITWEEVKGSNIQFGPPPDAVSFDTPPPSKPDATGNYPLPRPGVTTLG